jgi:predicted RNase H-like nuclease (RuvC/YqgF family)
VKDSVYQSFKKTIDAHYTKIKLEGEEKEKVLFQAHLDTLKSNPNASKMLDKERRDLDQIIAKHQQEINQLENNLGFISKSKAGDALRKDVEHKINLSKNKIKELKSKIKLLTNE